MIIVNLVTVLILIGSVFFAVLTDYYMGKCILQQFINDSVCFIGELKEWESYTTHNLNVRIK